MCSVNGSANQIESSSDGSLLVQSGAKITWQDWASQGRRQINANIMIANRACGSTITASPQLDHHYS
jgi:hypothetical protein